MSTNCAHMFSNENVHDLAQRMINKILRYGHLEGFTNQQIYRILNHACRILTPLPAMIELGVPLTIFGDIHGQLRDLIRYFDIIGYPPKHQMLFLGDYVDRGTYSFEVIMLLFCYKIKYPHMIHLLRGNHECFKMNRLYGFYSELRMKRSTVMWKKFQTVFNELPLCALVNRKILCMHGGISQNATSWNSFYQLKKPKRPKTCDEGLALDLMWADPTQEKCSTFAVNALRSISVIFGETAVNEFMAMLDLSLIVRAHEVSQEGFQFMFNKRVVTVFSAPFYCGSDSNCGAIMHLSENFEQSFTVLRPRMIPTPENAELARAMESNFGKYMAPSPDPNRGRHVKNTENSAK